MSANKTVETEASVVEFLDTVDNEQRRQDAYALVDIMRQATGTEPKMWGPAIVGFGKYRYRYDSGREGEMLRVGFSPRKANLALYLMAKDEQVERMIDSLGKCKRGGGCLYINKLADIDVQSLRELVSRSWALAREQYGVTESG